MNFYPFHLGDYAAATRHLTWDEDMAYRRLLDAYYEREEPLPADPRALFRLVRASTSEQREAVETVLQEFFERDGDTWRQFRCDEEVAKVRKKRDSASGSARTRWERERALHPQSERIANAQETPCERTEESKIGNAPNPNPNPNPTSLIPTTLRVATPRQADESMVADLLGHVAPPEPEPYKPPPCPQGEVLSLWAAEMPDLPQHVPGLWKGTRADHLRARWREMAVLHAWPDQAAGLEYFRGLFRHCRQSKFLMGRIAGRERRAFELELAWLVNPTNFAKVIEGKYHST